MDKFMFEVKQSKMNKLIKLLIIVIITIIIIIIIIILFNSFIADKFYLSLQLDYPSTNSKTSLKPLAQSTMLLNRMLVPFTPDI